MNKKQWFGSAIVFFVAATLTGAMATTFGTAGLITGTYDNVWLASRIYAALTWLMYCGLSQRYCK